MNNTAKFKRITFGAVTLVICALMLAVDSSDLFFCAENKDPSAGHLSENIYISEDVREVEEEIIRLVNEIRTENGLTPLKEDPELTKVARYKSADMSENGYFSHNSQTYGSPFDMMKSFGVRYRTAGENIARGYKTAKAAVSGWMNSSEHRANILSKSFDYIGVGYEPDGNYYTQMFFGR